MTAGTYSFNVVKAEYFSFYWNFLVILFLNKIPSILRKVENILNFKSSTLQWKEIALEVLHCLMNATITSKKEKYFK